MLAAGTGRLGAMDRLRFYSGWLGVDRIELRDPAETLSVRGGPWARRFSQGPRARIYIQPLEGHYQSRVIEQRYVKSQLAFASTGPMFEMPIATMLDEMTARDGGWAEQPLQHVYDW